LPFLLGPTPPWTYGVSHWWTQPKRLSRRKYTQQKLPIHSTNFIHPSRNPRFYVKITFFQSKANRNIGPIWGKTAKHDPNNLKFPQSTQPKYCFTVLESYKRHGNNQSRRGRNQYCSHLHDVRNTFNLRNSVFFSQIAYFGLSHIV
jgi:hypothetical protein